MKLSTRKEHKKERPPPINMLRNQIIIRVYSTNIFKNIKKTVEVKELDQESTIGLLKNPFNSTRINAFLIDDVFFLIFKAIFVANLRVIRCFQKVEDVEDENKLTEIIRSEHLSKNHRGIQSLRKITNSNL